MEPLAILHFRFEKLTNKQHFIKDTALDAAIRKCKKMGQKSRKGARLDFPTFHKNPEAQQTSCPL